MTVDPPQLNLLLAWLWFTAGFVSGMVMGLFFQRPEWLGGYGSLKRRLYRLGHISFFGLGAINLMFYLTSQTITTADTNWSPAGWAFIVGALTMPACCLLMAHAPRAQPLFAVPVLSLVAGGVLTCMVCYDSVAQAAQPAVPPTASRRDAPIPTHRVESHADPLHRVRLAGCQPAAPQTGQSAPPKPALPGKAGTLNTRNQVFSR